MELCVFVEPQMGATYDDQLRVARAAEAAGFHGFFRSDHFLTMGQAGEPGPTDAWVALAGIARETARVRLGTLMTSATFRLPGILAVTVAQVDAMSGGRVELGIGAGWFEAEHSALGIPFPPVGERFERLEEQLQILTGLWGGESPFDFDGRHYQMRQNPGLPRPAQRPRPPLLVGGFGPRRTPRLAARYADEYNMFTPSVEMFDERVAITRDACVATGRDPATLRLSTVQTVCCGHDDAEVRRRAARIRRTVDELRPNNAVGTPAELVDNLSAWAERGVARVYLQLLDMTDLDQIELLGTAVLPDLGPVGA